MGSGPTPYEQTLETAKSRRTGFRSSWRIASGAGVMLAGLAYSATDFFQVRPGGASMVLGCVEAGGMVLVLSGLLRRSRRRRKREV